MTLLYESIATPIEIGPVVFQLDVALLETQGAIPLAGDSLGHGLEHIGCRCVHADQSQLRLRGQAGQG